MKSYILTVVDTTGIQGFVFGANQLRQIVGASYLVDCATRDWAVDALEGMKRNSIHLKEVSQPFGSERIERDDLDAELIYAGGGNTVLLFKTLDLARAFTRKLTRRVLQDAPGLGVVVVHKEFAWNVPLGGKGGIFFQTMQELARQKAHRVPPIPALGLGVTAECVYTSLPAVALDHGRLISTEAQAKQKAGTWPNEKTASPADRRLQEFIANTDFFAPREFEELDQSPGEKSMLAVVHIDGNGMGKRIERLVGGHSTGNEANRECLDDLRAFSISVQTASRSALQSLVGHLLLLDKTFRPIVYGGDDITFVCDARLGLGLTVYYLRKLGEQTLADGSQLECRAGVAMIPSHYPFARGYNLASELADSSKKIINRVKDDFEQQQGHVEGVSCTAIDWHMATSGLEQDLESIRQREYQVRAGKLYSRPLFVDVTLEGRPAVQLLPNMLRWRSFDAFAFAVREFQGGEDWEGRHNRMKALRETLRRGSDALRRFKVTYDVHWPSFHLPEDVQDGGWWDERSLYYDAVEMADLMDLEVNEVVA